MAKRKRYATVYGSPGTLARLEGLIRTQWPLLAAVAVAGYLMRAAYPAPPLPLPVTGALFLLLALAVAATTVRSRSRLQAFLKGAKGEEITARQLSLLPEDYAVFHGVTIKHGRRGKHQSLDFDHVVVGPNGIFLVETKNWSDRITIKDGTLLYGEQEPSRPPLDQVKSGAKSLERFLASTTGSEIPVHPLLCFASNNLPNGQQGAVGVLICNADLLNEAIAGYNENSCSDAQRNSIISILRQHCEE